LISKRVRLLITTTQLLFVIGIGFIGGYTETVPGPGISDRYAVIIKGKTGYINSKGELVIPAQFQDSSAFSGGLARAELNGKVGYIDPSGALRIPARFDDGRDFSEGLACVRQGGLWGYIKFDGVFQIRPQYTISECSQFHDGRAAIDANQSPLGKLEFHALKRVYYIDTLGIPLNIKSQQRVVSIGDFSDGVAWIGVPGQPWWVINRAGNILSSSVSVCLQPNGFHNGLASVEPKCGSKTGFVDVHGKFVISPAFEEAGDFSDGLAFVRTNGKYGYIDTTGAFAISPTFDKALPFGQGLAFVKVGDKWGVIDKKGSWIVVPTFHLVGGTGEFSGELGAVMAVERSGGKCDINLRYINHAGATVWGPSSILPPVTSNVPDPARAQEIEQLCKTWW
jgi:hypothetical protein